MEKNDTPQSLFPPVPYWLRVCGAVFTGCLTGLLGFLESRHHRAGAYHWLYALAGCCQGFVMALAIAAAFLWVRTSRYNRRRLDEIAADNAVIGGSGVGE